MAVAGSCGSLVCMYYLHVYHINQGDVAKVQHEVRSVEAELARTKDKLSDAQSEIQHQVEENVLLLDQLHRMEEECQHLRHVRDALQGLRTATEADQQPATSHMLALCSLFNQAAFADPEPSGCDSKQLEPLLHDFEETKESKESEGEAVIDEKHVPSELDGDEDVTITPSDSDGFFAKPIQIKEDDHPQSLQGNDFSVEKTWNVTSEPDEAENSNDHTRQEPLDTGRKDDPEKPEHNSKDDAEEDDSEDDDEDADNERGCYSQMSVCTVSDIELEDPMSYGINYYLQIGAYKEDLEAARRDVSLLLGEIGSAAQQQAEIDELRAKYEAEITHLRYELALAHQQIHSMDRMIQECHD